VPDGWYAQDIPGVALGNRSVAFLTPAPDSVLVLYDLYDAPQKLDSLKLIERTAAGWQAPVVLATWPQTLDSTTSPPPRLPTARGWRWPPTAALLSCDCATALPGAKRSADAKQLRLPSRLHAARKGLGARRLGTYGECFAGQFANYVLYEEP